MAGQDEIVIKGRSAAQRAQDAICTAQPHRGKLTTVGIPPIAPPVPPQNLLSSQDRVQQKERDITNLYEYTSLPDAGKFIRILSLAPGSGSTPLRGEIFTCPISKVVGYEALSY